MNENVQICFKQYQNIPQILKKPYDSDDSLMVLNHMLDRDSFLSNIEEIQNELKIADKNLKEALKNTTSIWREKIIEATNTCGVNSEWWQNIVNSI